MCLKGESLSSGNKIGQIDAKAHRKLTRESLGAIPEQQWCGGDRSWWEAGRVFRICLLFLFLYACSSFSVLFLLSSPAFPAWWVCLLLGPLFNLIYFAWWYQLICKWSPNLWLWVLPFNYLKCPTLCFWDNVCEGPTQQFRLSIFKAKFIILHHSSPATSSIFPVLINNFNNHIVTQARNIVAFPIPFCFIPQIQMFTFHIQASLNSLKCLSIRSYNGSHSDDPFKILPGGVQQVSNLLIFIFFICDPFSFLLDIFLENKCLILINVGTLSTV